MGKYDDIINLEHHVSKNHKQMSIYDRSAQFAPFAALTGYDESINEASRITDSRIDLGNDKIEEISRTLSFIHQSNDKNLTISVTYFKADKTKKGGEYKTITGQIKKVDPNEKKLFLSKNTSIDFKDIIDIAIL